MKGTIIFTIVFFISIVSKSQMPDLEVKKLDMSRISLNDLKGEKLTVLDFWATWCKPCVSAIPKLNNLYNEISAEGVEFIGVNIDGPRNQSKVKPFVKSLDISYPVILDPDQELVDEFNVTVFPTLIVFDNKGREVFSHEGFNQGDEEVIKKELEQLLKK